MYLALASFGDVFATRERARALVAETGQAQPNDELRLDITGVCASPSFMAELLALLAARFVAVEVVGGTDHLVALTQSLVSKLGLIGRVRVVGLACV